jgi:transposase
LGQNFIADTVNQTLLFPPSLHDWLPEGHLARFLLDVVSALDLSALYKSYQEKDGRGRAAYAPEMMVRLLLYGYARGVYSSRKIQTRTFDNVAFRYFSGDQHPDHATIAEFRKRHLEALYCLRAQFEPQPCKPLDRPWQKRYARHTPSASVNLRMGEIRALARGARRSGLIRPS